MSTVVSDFNKKMEKKIAEIWRKPPAEIVNVRKPMGVFAHSLPMINFAFHSAQSLTSQLFRLRGHAAKGDIPLDIITLLSKEIVDREGLFLALYGLKDTGELLKEASAVFAKIKNAQEYIEMVDKVNIYVNKLGGFGWLDAEMKWAKVSGLFEAIK